MMRFLFYLFSVLFIPFYNSLLAQQYNYSEHIAPIIYEKCTGCHRSGGIAPVRFENYNQVYSRAGQIDYYTSSRIMPPWPPDNSYRKFAHDRSLTNEEVSKISQWVNDGAPRGDSLLEPALPAYPSGSELGIADTVYTIPTYAINTIGTEDIYRCFVIPSGNLNERFLKGIDVIPGNRSAVHHVLIYQDTTGTCKALDNNDPLPGYNSFGGVGEASAELMGVWVPGMIPVFYPSGMGFRLKPNADIVLQVHYPIQAVGKKDSTSVHLFYNNSPAVRRLYITPVLNHFQLQNGPLLIPADSIKEFYSQYTVFANVSVLGIAPHMHLIGKEIESYAVLSGVNDTVPLINIPDWDFHWQSMYYFQKVQKLPFLTKLHGRAKYDNTSNNDHNPNFPPKEVKLGEGTTDEMMLIYFLYTIYQSGDENIVIDSTLLSSVKIQADRVEEKMSLYPVPAIERVSLRFFSDEDQNMSIKIIDVMGKVVEDYPRVTFSKGYSEFVIELASKIPAGMYLLNAQSIKNDKIYNARFVVRR